MLCICSAFNWLQNVFAFACFFFHRGWSGHSQNSCICRISYRGGCEVGERLVCINIPQMTDRENKPNIGGKCSTHAMHAFGLIVFIDSFPAVGDSVSEDEVVCEIETDKVWQRKRETVYFWRVGVLLKLRQISLSCASRPRCKSPLLQPVSSRSYWCLTEGR